MHKEFNGCYPLSLSARNLILPTLVVEHFLTKVLQTFFFQLVLNSRPRKPGVTLIFCVDSYEDEVYN